MQIIHMVFILVIYACRASVGLSALLQHVRATEYGSKTYD